MSRARTPMAPSLPSDFECEFYAKSVRRPHGAASQRALAAAITRVGRGKGLETLGRAHAFGRSSSIQHESVIITIKFRRND